METICISNEELKQLKKINNDSISTSGSLYIYDSDLLLKVFENPKYFCEERRRNVNFLRDKIVRNSRLPRGEVIVDGVFSGYSEYIFKDSKTFGEGTSMTYLDRLKVVRDVYEALRDIHNLDVFLGDVHTDNLLYSEKEKEGCIIDFEDIRFKGDENKFRECYHVNYFSEIINSNQNTDNIKAAICALSFIYEIDLGWIVALAGINSLLVLLGSTNIPCIRDLQGVLTNFDGKVEYFDDLIPIFKSQDFEANKQKLLITKRKYFG